MHDDVPAVEESARAAGETGSPPAKLNPAPHASPGREARARRTSERCASHGIAEQRLCSCLRAAARSGDRRSVHELACELVSRQLPAIRRRVSRRLHAPGWSHADRDDAAATASERIFVALQRNALRICPRLLAAVVAKNVDWAVIEVRRERSRRWRRELPTDPCELPETAIDSPPCPLEQATVASGLLQPMSERERSIVYEHHVRELDLDVIARRYGMSTAAVKKTLQRGKRKAREEQRIAEDVPFWERRTG